MSSEGFDRRPVGYTGSGGHGMWDAPPEDHDPGHKNEPTVHVVDRYN